MATFRILSISERVSFISSYQTALCYASKLGIIEELHSHEQLYNLRIIGRVEASGKTVSKRR